MKPTIIAAALLLSACTTSLEGMSSAPAARVYHSAKPRAAIAECLLNRVGSDDMTPHRTDAEGTTTLGFTGRGLAMKPAIYQFSIRDDGAGSVIEARRFAKANLANAETCF